ncbi:Biotin carboxyl carrier protein of acetyl-CoA carboxylase 2, chloroplastic, partial [Mucuna pruriens]
MASFTVPCPKCVVPFAHLGLNSQIQQRNAPLVSFRSGLGFNKSLSFGSLSAPNGIQCLNQKQFSEWKLQAQTNKAVTVENSAPVQVNGPKVAPLEEKDDHNGKPSGPSATADASSVSAFMNKVSDLVKLVDSRDIVELQLKQADFELMIRKKEALQPPPATVVAPVQPFSYPTQPLPAAPPAVATSSPGSPPPSKAAPALAPPKASTSSHPPLKSPMAGTFYQSPAPTEPPFVKVGDKVQKGQVVCIIEAMKLMNEIEADHSGTVTEIIAEDGKPVSVDTVLSLSLSLCVSLHSNFVSFSN